MGIKGLAKLLSDEAPDCVREVPLSSLHGRKVAIDASMAIYQFLIAVRHGNPNNPVAAALTNADGETTSHLQGMFNRTIRFLSEGIRPVFVFDGKPPALKRTVELEKRRARREKAAEDLKKATEEGNTEEMEKMEKRLVRAGKKENDDCAKLLTLMGVPVVRAPCEAEAQAAALCTAKRVYAVGTEDMDALTFRTPVLLRKMTFANASKFDLQKLEYDKALEGLNLTHDEFVDLCILLGCDYCDSIRGVGPKTALKLVREHGSIENILKAIEGVPKYTVPDSWQPGKKKENEAKKKKEEEKENTDDENDDDVKKEKDEQKDEKDDDDEEEEEEEPAYVGARRLFNEHEVTPDAELDLKWTPCDADGLIKFLVDDNGFNPDRVRSGVEKLQKAFKASAKPQARMDSFFTKIVKKRPTPPTKKEESGKRTKKGTGATTKKKGR